MFRLVIFSCLFLATFAVPHKQTKPTEERIVGGSDTEITEVPHLVSVQYNNQHWCGGSIVGLKHILTAAHCVEKRNKDLFSVRAGSSYHNKDGQVVKVAKIIKHPDYNPYTSNYDLAVLVLKEPLTGGDKVGIATLANVEPQAGDTVLLSGWGSIQENKGFSSFLQSVSVPVIAKEVCRTKYKPEEVTDQMFCAGFNTGGKDACQGDSGGPAMVKGKLAGIVSWGEGCADGKYPGVYTNIASVLPWIGTHILE